MRLSTSTNIAAFRGEKGRNPFAFCIPLCAKAGYKALDINFCEAMNPASRLRDPDWESYIHEIAALGREWGVEFSQSHLPYYDLFAPGAEEKAPVMEELIRRCIRASGMLGVRWAVTHPGTKYDAGPDINASREANLRYYAPHVALARASEVGIALENDFEYRGGPARRMYCASIPELTDLCDGFQSPFVGICYDFGHANLTGGFHRQNLRLIGKRLKAVHVQDNHGERDEHLMPFFGAIDWREAMAALKEIGYQGDLTYEIQNAGRYFPNEHKHLVAELSVRVGEILLEMFESAEGGPPQAEARS